jgi:ubiquitin carboxyl-terminal hydrolase 6/32
MQHASVKERQEEARRPVTLVDCLDAFAKEEKLGEDELWYCSRCQTHRAAAKKLDVWALPPFLVIHLKRFHMHNGRWIKSSTNVSFPQEGLEPARFALGSGAGQAASEEGVLSPAQAQEAQAAESEPAAPGGPVETDEATATCGAAEEEEEENTQPLTPATHGAETASEEGGEEGSAARDDGSAAEGLAPSQLPCGESPAFSVQQAGRHYDLYALVCHQGILGGGHYIAYARTSSDEWYCYNDSACRKVRKWSRGDSVKCKTSSSFIFSTTNNPSQVSPEVVAKQDSAAYILFYRCRELGGLESSSGMNCRNYLV